MFALGGEAPAESAPAEKPAAGQAAFGGVSTSRLPLQAVAKLDAQICSDMLRDAQLAAAVVLCPSRGSSRLDAPSAQNSQRCMVCIAWHSAGTSREPGRQDDLLDFTFLQALKQSLSDDKAPHRATYRAMQHGRFRERRFPLKLRSSMRST